MQTQLPIAIVGGGPAGAFAASLVAARGHKVLLFDEKLAWEKPCGGGLTHRALEQYPFLGDAQAERSSIQHCELISPSGRRVRFRLRYPLAIFSRFVLNGLLLERARKAAADIRQERVIRISGTGSDWRLTTSQGEHRAAFLVLAAGARCSFRGQFAPPFSPDDLMVTAGYYIPERRSLVQIQFLHGIAGYIWVFPRPDHLSAGIVGRMGVLSTAELRRMLEAWLEQNGFRFEGARFFSHLLPALREQTLKDLQVCGEGWAAIGDAAGLVDSITGEGLYYALRSAELCAQALLAGDPSAYPAALDQEILPELRLAARASRHFYSGQVLGESVVERVVSLTEQSKSIRDLMSDLFAGIQGYRDLRSRLYRNLPTLLAEGLAGTLHLPRGGGALATHPFAE
jgi:geranylgeranyl diphosphate/geranylgeranyl-bacteriochlorophyllide a reductase